MALTDKLTAIADAIRTKTGSTEKLTLAQMPTEIAGIQGGGSMETGEFVGTSSTFWGFTIPVSSKKTHVVMYPKVFEDETHNSGRVSYFLVAEGWGQIEIRKGGSIYMRPSTDFSTTFNDTSIVFGGGKAPYNIGEYYWYAW